MNFEQVLCSDGNTDYQVEYIAEDEEVVQLSSRGSAVIQQFPELSNIQPVKRKVPIIRKPGEIVTPGRAQTTTSNPKEFTSSSPSNQSLAAPRPIITARIKPEWKKVEPPTKTLTAKSFDHTRLEIITADRITLNPADMEPNEPQTQLDRIERKMDEILTRLDRHEATFGQLKGSIKDIRIELKSSVIDLKQVNREGTYARSNAQTPVPAKRKCVVVFPVSDDATMQRLEHLIQTDDEILEDITALFKTAPVSSLYDFLRHNLNALLKNCSKYTWTGKPSNSCPSAGPCNAACDSFVVGHLITCAGEVFPNATSDAVSKEFRHVLHNFNDALKRRRRAEKLREASLTEESNAAASDDDDE